MRVLALSSAYGGACAAVLQDGDTLARGRIADEHGLAAALPALLADIVGRAGRPELIGVIVGPGSFTGLRAGLSVAHGIALGCAIPLVGVTVAEALAEAALSMLDGRVLWTAIAARRGRIFLDVGGVASGHDLGALSAAPRRCAVAGNAANQVAAILAARGVDVMLTALRAPDPACVAAIALRRANGLLPPCQALPLYVEAPQARTAGLRAPPVPAASG